MHVVQIVPWPTRTVQVPLVAGDFIRSKSWLDEVRSSPYGQYTWYAIFLPV